MIPSERAAADEPRDALDARILDGIRDLWDAADPMPAELIDHIRFVIDLGGVDIEVLRLTEERQLAAARGEHARLITFASDSVTLMVAIGDNQDGTNRIDGWLAPLTVGRLVVLRTARGSQATESDVHGRFWFNSISPGNAQFVIPLDTGARHVATPTIAL